MINGPLLTLRSSATPYLTLLIISIVGGQLLQYAYRAEPIFKAQSASILFVLGTAVMTVVLWSVLMIRRRMVGLPLLVIAGMIALWSFATLRIVSQDGAFNYTALFTPAVLFMLALKPPDSREAIRFGDTTAVALAISVATTQLLDLFGLRDNRTDIVSRWGIPIPGFDTSVRWEGMFSDPNFAGFVGAFLCTYGLFRWHRRISTWAAPLGVLIVVVSESRSAIAATCVGLATFLVLRGRRLVARLSVPNWILMFGAGLLFTIPAILSLVVDPTLNGRIPIWRSMIELAAESPLIGVGSDRILEASQEAIIPWGNLDGHSVVLDPLARNGVVAGAIALLVLAGVALLSIRAIPRDLGLSFGVFATFLLGAMTYTVTTWQYPTVQLLPLLTALLIASAGIQVSRRRSRPPRRQGDLTRQVIRQE